MGGGTSAQASREPFGNLPTRLDMTDCKRYAGKKYIIHEKAFEAFKDAHNRISHAQFLRTLLDVSGKSIVSRFDYDVCLIAKNRESELIIRGLEAQYLRVTTCNDSDRDIIVKSAEASKSIAVAIHIKDILGRVTEVTSTGRSDPDVSSNWLGSNKNADASFSENNACSSQDDDDQVVNDSEMLQSTKDSDAISRRNVDEERQAVQRIIRETLEDIASIKRPVIPLVIHKGTDDEIQALAAILEDLSALGGCCPPFEWGPEEDIFNDKCHQFVEIVKEVTGSKLCQEEDDEAMELVFGRPIPRPPVALPVQPGRTVLSLPENVNPDTIKRIPPVGNHDQGDDEQKGEDEARDDGKEDDDHDSANDDNSTLFGNADDHNSIDGGSQDGIDRTDVPRRESNVVHGYGGKKNKKRVDDGVKECPEDDIDDVILGGGMPINCADYRLYRTIKAQTMQPLTSFGITGIIPLRSTGKKKGAEAEAENMSFITAGSTDKMVRVWIPEDIHWSVAKEWKAHRNRVFSMTILSNGNLATGGSDKTIQIWSHKSWMWTNRGFIPSAHTGAIWCLCGMRNMLMISGGSTNDPTVKVWNMKRWSCLRTLTGHRDGISAAVELPNGTVATGGGNNDRTIRIWDIITGECKQTLKGNGQAVTGLAVLANGVLVSSGGDMTVRLWNTTKGTLIRVLRGHTAWINCVCVMGDGVTIASGASDKTIRIWNTTVREKKTKRIASAWGDEEEDVQSVHSLHSANSDGSHTKAPKVVVPTTVCTAVLEGHTNWVSALATLGDGTTLISGGFDDTLRIWNAPKF